MTIDAKLVKDLREKTGAGMMDCKKALVESEGDINKAIDNLRKSGIAKAEKKGARETREGLVYSYIHAGGRLGVLLELNCETDFVAKTDGFTELAHNLAMQIAATNPVALDRESIDEEIISREREIFTDQAKSEGKPDNIIEKMVEGRLSKFFQIVILTNLPHKDKNKRIKALEKNKLSIVNKFMSSCLMIVVILAGISEF